MKQGPNLLKFFRIVATFDLTRECKLCRERIVEKRKQNALARASKLKARMRAHLAEKHPAELEAHVDELVDAKARPRCECPPGAEIGLYPCPEHAPC